MADFTSMSSEDLSVWLQDQGIPSEYCEKFEGGSLSLLRRGGLITANDPFR